MLSLIIAGLQRIIPKLMAWKIRWFRHARRDFRIFALLGTKRLGTKPYFTSPWVTRCLNTPLFHFSLYFLFFGKHCYSNGPGCGLGLPSHLG
jgi:hypothetical protein